jgi:hypothetical protein
MAFAKHISGRADLTTWEFGVEIYQRDRRTISNVINKEIREHPIYVALLSSFVGRPKSPLTIQINLEALDAYDGGDGITWNISLRELLTEAVNNLRRGGRKAVDDEEMAVIIDIARELRRLADHIEKAATKPIKSK